MKVEIVVKNTGKPPRGWQFVEVRVSNGTEVGHIQFADIRKQKSLERAIQVARSLVEFSLRDADNPTIDSRDSTFDVDLASALYHCVIDSKRRPPRNTWWDGLFPNPDKASWSDLFHEAIAQGGFEVAFRPGHELEVVDEDGDPVGEQDRRRIAGGGALAHLQAALTALQSAVAEARTAPVAFWPWLTAEVLLKAVPLIAHPRETSSTDPRGYLAIIENGLTWATDAFALCGAKPFPIERYYRQFFDISTCRLFLLPSDPKKRAAIQSSIDEHNRHAPTVRGLGVEPPARATLSLPLLGITDALDFGFGFVVLHDRHTGRTEAVTHETRNTVFHHTSLRARTHLRSLLGLFELLAGESTAWNERKVRVDVLNRLAQVGRWLGDDGGDLANETLPQKNISSNRKPKPSRARPRITPRGKITRTNRSRP